MIMDTIINCSTYIRKNQFKMQSKMKNILKVLISTVLIFSAFSSCKDDVNLELPYLFRPINFAAELNKTEATLSWAPVDSAVSYTLQVSSDSLDFKKPILDTTLTVLNFKQEFAGKSTFYARIRANAADTTKHSKFNQIRFVTPAENLFEGFNSAMVGWQTIQVKWRPAANVNTLKLTANEVVVKTIALTADQILKGEIEVSTLSNSRYSVEIYNNSILRGTVKVLVEGDVYVESGQDIIAAINNATEGQVVVLAPGVVFPTGGGTYRFTKSVKIKGANPNSPSIICMTAGTPTSTSNIFGFADASIISFVRFENLDITGYCDNNTASTKIGYMFNNNLMTTVSNLAFNNCKLHNFGNTPMRLQAAKGQVIDTLTFNKCTVNEIGFSSTYAIVNVNSADYINNIYMTNSTFYNFKGSLILRTVTAPVVATMGNINITNCTVNQGMQDAGSARYLIDANGTTVTNGIAFKNCIFGSSGGALGANGVRKSASTNLSVTGSFYTTDYVDDPITVVTSYSIKPQMAAFAGASTALWNDPVNGDFKLKASAFAGKGIAGDLRWY